MSSFRKPIITMPVRVHRRALKRQEKQRLEELADQGSAYPKGDRKAMPVITCRRPELNHYQGQFYNPFKKLQFASEHWASRKTIGDFFSFNSYKKPLSTDFHNRIISENTRDKLGTTRPDFERVEKLSPSLKAGLKKLGFTHPTNIQEMSIRELLEGQSGILAAETGNGKTLAFLLPLLDKVSRLKEATSQVEAEHSVTHLNRPLAVVVAPGRELAFQIFNVARDLCTAAESAADDQQSNQSDVISGTHFHSMGLNVRLVLGGNVDEKIKRRLRPTDVLVGTAGALSKMFGRKFYRSGSCSVLVFDEADTMLDDSFRSVTYNLMRQLIGPQSGRQASMDDLQVIFSGATFPHYINEVFSEFVDENNVDSEGNPMIKTFRTGQLHRVPHHIYQKFIRAPKTNREDYLMDAIDSDLAKRHQVIIFSNKGSTSNWISHYLNEKGIICEAFNSSVYFRKRHEALDRFKRGEVKILSCTDLASRGIDTLNVHHVINYDFPSNASDYLHRIGRVGRVGSKQAPKVTSLVCGQTSVRVVQDLEMAVRMNREVEGTDGNVARVIKNRRLESEFEAEG